MDKSTAMSESEHRFTRTLNERDRVRAVMRDSVGATATAYKLEIKKLELQADQYDVSRTYKRADAFLNRSRRESLAKYPELDSAYKATLQAEYANRHLPRDERVNKVQEVVDRLYGSLRNGDVPRGNVSIEESARVINLSGNTRGLSVIDPQSVRQPGAKGLVVAESSHHVLVHMSEGTAVRQEKGSLDLVVKVGDVIAIAPNRHEYRLNEVNQSRNTNENVRNANIQRQAALRPELNKGFEFAR